MYCIHVDGNQLTRVGVREKTIFVPAFRASSSPWPSDLDVESAARPGSDTGGGGGGRTEAAEAAFVLLAADLYVMTQSLHPKYYRVSNS